MFDHFVPEKVAISLVPCNISICSDPTWLRIPGDGKKGVSNAKIVAAYAEMTLLGEGRCSQAQVQCPWGSTGSPWGCRCTLGS